MMRKWLQTLVDEYLPAIAELQHTAVDQAQASKWAIWMRQRWAEHGMADLKQQRNLMTDVRGAIKAQLGSDHVALESMNFTMAEWTTINNPIAEQVARRNENVVLLDNPDAIVALAVRLLKSREWAEVAAGLVVLTGRRSSEILATAEFLPKSQWSVLFTGALKRREEAQRLSFEIPTLATAERVITALAKLRSVCPTQGLTAKQINLKYAHAVATACDRLFSDLVPKRDGRDNLFTHLFRSVYAAIATLWYAPPTVDASEYKAAIQGHYAVLDTTDTSLRRSLAASRHYNDYKIADSQGNIDGRQGIKLGYGGVAVIDVFNPELRTEKKAVADDRAVNAVNDDDLMEGEEIAVADDQEVSQRAIESVALELEALPIVAKTQEKSQEAFPTRKRAARRLKQVSVDLDLLKSVAGKLGVVMRSGKGQGYELALLELLLLLEQRAIGRDEGENAGSQTPSQTVADQAKTLAWLTGRVEHLEALLQWEQHEKKQEKEAIGQGQANDQALLERELLQTENRRLEAELQQTRSRLEGIQQFLSGGDKQSSTTSNGETSNLSQPHQTPAELVPQARAIGKTPDPIKTTTATPHPSQPRLSHLDSDALRALHAILDFNDHIATNHAERWSISIPVMKDLLKQLGKATQPKIEAVLRANSQTIQQHHQNHGLGERHNRVHQGHSISEVITL